MIRKRADFSKLPKSLTELDVIELDVKLIPNCLPPNLKHLKLREVRKQQVLNVSDIFPNTTETLLIGCDPKSQISPNEALQANILLVS